jgi:hypothetical protein
MYYVNKSNFEVSGFGNVIMVDGIPTVDEIFLIKQENHSTETEMEAEAIGKALYDHHVSGMEGELKFWWHSHVNMSVFWSKTDTDTIEQLTQDGWFIHGVFNKKYEYRCAYSNNDPVHMFVDDLEMEIDEDLYNNDKLIDLKIQMEMLKDDILKEMSTELDKKYDELVTVKTYTYPSYNNGLYGGWAKNSTTGVWEKTVATGKHSAATKAETSQITTPLGLVTHTTGKKTTSDTTGSSDLKNYTEFLDPDGAMRLMVMGYTRDEVRYMERFCYVEEPEDLEWYESYHGLMQTTLNNDMYQCQPIVKVK